MWRGGCELAMATRHLHKGQGSMPSGGKGWHHAFQTGRGKTGETGRGGGNSASLVPKEEVPGCWQRIGLNL